MEVRQKARAKARQMKGVRKQETRKREAERGG